MRSVGSFVFVAVLVVASCGGQSVERRADDAPTTSGGTGSGGGVGATGGTGGTAGAGSTGGGFGATGGLGGSGGNGASVAGGTGGFVTGGTGGTGGAGVGGAGGSGTPTSCGTLITATPESNYSLKSLLSVETTKVRPRSELFFDWSGARTDFLGRDLDPTAIDMVEIALWRATPDAFVAGLNADSLSSGDLVFIATIQPNPSGSTSGSIFDMTESGEPIEPEIIDEFLDHEAYPPERHVYTAMLANGTELGQGTRTIQAFQLDPDSTNTQVDITANSSAVALAVNLHTLEMPSIPASLSEVTVDWTDMTVTAAGKSFDPYLVTQVRIAAFSLTPSEMEARDTFVNLESKADLLYSTYVKAGTSISLAGARDASGAPFPGIDDSHTWVLALDCTTCSIKAPWYMTVLAVCPPKVID